jgi:hypothetical protein
MERARLIKGNDDDDDDDDEFTIKNNYMLAYNT